MKKVFIVSEYPATEYRIMMEEQGWGVVSKPSQADLLLFTGGADVHPSLYNEPIMSGTHTDLGRDKAEALLFEEYADKLPMVGICRGAQFLHVMCGGTLWQDVTNHGRVQGHMAMDNTTGKEISVTSTHHQMMKPDCGDILMQGLVENCDIRLPDRSHVHCNVQVEAIIHPKQGVLCYQPHPEIDSVGGDCRKTFFKYLEFIIND